jgi:hypothetical protein
VEGNNFKQSSPRRRQKKYRASNFSLRRIRGKHVFLKENKGAFGDNGLGL